MTISRHFPADASPSPWAVRVAVSVFSQLFNYALSPTPQFTVTHVSPFSKQRVPQAQNPILFIFEFLTTILYTINTQ